LPIGKGKPGFSIEPRFGTGRRGGQIMAFSFSNNWTQERRGARRGVLPGRRQPKALEEEALGHKPGRGAHDLLAGGCWDPRPERIRALP